MSPPLPPAAGPAPFAPAFASALASVFAPVATRAPGGGVRSLRGPAPLPAAAAPAADPAGTVSPVPRPPESLHPALWRAHQLGRHLDPPLPSGFPRLDAQLPGGGWPRRGLTELLLPHPGVGEMRLLGPVLAQVLAEGRLAMLFDPPGSLSAQALQQLGIDAQQLRADGDVPQHEAALVGDRRHRDDVPNRDRRAADG